MWTIIRWRRRWRCDVRKCTKSTRRRLMGCMPVDCPSYLLSHHAPCPVRLANSFFQRDDFKVFFYAYIADIVDKQQSPERPWWASHVLTLPILSSYLQYLQLPSPDRPWKNSSILHTSFLRKPRSLTTKPRHRLDVTSDHYSLDSRNLLTLKTYILM